MNVRQPELDVKKAKEMFETCDNDMKALDARILPTLIASSSPEELIALRTKDGNTICHLAVQQKDLVSLQKLQKIDERILQLPNKRHDTPLHMATFTGRNDIVVFLVENKADVRAKNDRNQTPLRGSYRTTDSLMIGYLTQNKARESANDDARRFNPYFEMSVEKAVEIFEACDDSRSSYSLDTVDDRVLSTLIASTSADKLRALRTKGSSTVAHLAAVQDNLDDTPLLKAIERIAPDILFIKNTKDQPSPFKLAMKHHNKAAVKYFVRTGKVNVNEGELYWAMNTHQVDIVQLFVEHKADVHARNYGVNDTPLHYAIDLGNLKIVEFLVKTAKADIYAETPYSEPALERRSASADIYGFLVAVAQEDAAKKSQKQIQGPAQLEVKMEMKATPPLNGVSLFQSSNAPASEIKDVPVNNRNQASMQGASKVMQAAGHSRT